MGFAQFAIHVQTKFCQSTAYALTAERQKKKKIFRKRGISRIWKKIHELAEYAVLCSLPEEKQLSGVRTKPGPSFATVWPEEHLRVKHV